MLGQHTSQGPDPSVPRIRYPSPVDLVMRKRGTKDDLKLIFAIRRSAMLSGRLDVGCFLCPFSCTLEVTSPSWFAVWPSDPVIHKDPALFSSKHGPPAYKQFLPQVSAFLAHPPVSPVRQPDRLQPSASMQVTPPPQAPSNEFRTQKQNPRTALSMCCPHRARHVAIYKYAAW